MGFSDLFKETGDTKGTLHANIGTIKERNCMDLTKAQGIKKRCRENAKELYKKDLNDPHSYGCVITHLEPEILEIKVSWALESIAMNKASDDYEIPAELFLILKDAGMKVLHSICHQIWKTQQWPQDWKRSISI